MRAERSFVFPHNVLHPKWELVVKISKTMIEFFGEKWPPNFVGSHRPTHFSLRNKPLLSPSGC